MEGPYKLDKDLKVIDYKSESIKFRLNSLPKEGDAAIITVEKGSEAHECDEDGEEEWTVVFELMHSKKKDADLEGNNPQDYECCGSRIDSEEIEITIDCGSEQKDEEDKCDTNKLINEECKCGEETETCGDVGADEWNICCDIEGDEKVIHCSRLITEEEKEDARKDGLIYGKKILDEDYLNILCEVENEVENEKDKYIH